MYLDSPRHVNCQSCRFNRILKVRTPPRALVGHAGQSPQRFLPVAHGVLDSSILQVMNGPISPPPFSPMQTFSVATGLRRLTRWTLASIFADLTRGQLERSSTRPPRALHALSGTKSLARIHPLSVLPQSPVRRNRIEASNDGCQPELRGEETPRIPSKNPHANEYGQQRHVTES